MKCGHKKGILSCIVIDFLTTNSTIIPILLKIYSWCGRNIFFFIFSIYIKPYSN